MVQNSLGKNIKMNGAMSLKRPCVTEDDLAEETRGSKRPKNVHDAPGVYSDVRVYATISSNSKRVKSNVPSGARNGYVDLSKPYLCPESDAYKASQHYRHLFNTFTTTMVN
ncbi:hypothetical protein VTN96DRAFT_9082 [Rasamsonia emersonii]